MLWEVEKSVKYHWQPIKVSSSDLSNKNSEQRENTNGVNKQKIQHKREEKKELLKSKVVSIKGYNRNLPGYSPKN